MNSAIADILKSYIDGLSFVDRITGLVKTVTIQQTGDSGTVKKTFPVACDVDNAACVSGKYKDLLPDSSKKSVIYFEDFGSRPLGIEKGEWKFSSTLRLVGWLNLNKMGVSNHNFGAIATMQVISQLPLDYINSGNFKHIKITSISQPQLGAGVFSRYTYDEAINQYLLYPYDYFALDITVEFLVNKNCIEYYEIPDLPICDDNNNTPNPSTPTIGECWDLLRWDCVNKMWVRFPAPTTIGTWVIQRNEDGSLEWVSESSGGEEIDPIFTNWLNSVAQVANWNTAFGWGNHATAGYATSIALNAEATARANADAALLNAISSHTSDTNNPHNVTKSQVGLSNVDNTSDVNKPVSTAQAAADTAVLNAAATDATTKANAAETNAKAYADTLVVGLVDDRGNYDASVNVYPSTGGSGTAGAVLKGDLWTVSVAGTLGGVDVTAGDLVRALVDTPGQTASNWAVTENNIGYVAENSANKTDTMAGNTASSVKYLSAKGVYDWVISLGYITISALSGYLTAATAATTYQVILTAANFGSFINGLISKATPIDADYLSLWDSVSQTAQKLSWANLKATLKTYFDGLYAPKHWLIDTTQTTVQGTTTELKACSIPIPAGWFASGNGMSVVSFAEKSGQTANDTWQHAMYINSSDSLTGAVFIGWFQPSNLQRHNGIERKCFVFTSNTNLQAFATASVNTDIAALSSALTNYTVPNITSAMYLIIGLKHTGSSQADTIRHLKTVVYRET